MPLSAAALEAIDRIECELLEAEYQVRRLNLWLAARFSPDQPRVPAGRLDGGQWTREGSGGAQLEPAQELLIGRLPPWIGDLLRSGELPEEALDAFREPIPGQSGKEAASDHPGWADGERPMIRESGKDFAKLMDEKYRPGKYKPGPDSEFNQIQKWGDRHFRIPRWFEERFKT